MPASEGAPKRAATFLGLVWATSAVFYFLIIYCGRLGGGQQVFVLGLMWSPGVAALLTAAIHRRRISEFGWRWGQTRYQMTTTAGRQRGTA